MNQDKARSASAEFASVYFQILCMEKVIHVGKWCVCKCVLQMCTICSGKEVL